MNIFLKILCIIAIILIVIIVLFFLLLLIPFPYFLSVNYDERKIDLKFRYLVINIFGFIDFSKPIKYRLQMLKKVLFDSEVRSEKKEKKTDSKDKKINQEINSTSISDTDFIKDKNLTKEISDTKAAAKDLLLAAKKYEKSMDKVESKKSLKASFDNLLSKLKNLIPYDMIYVIKKISDEVLNIIDIIKPRNYSFDITYGLGDPYMTGIAYSFLAPFMAVTDGKLDANLDFKDTNFKSDLRIRGNIILFRFVFIAIRLILDKRFRSIVFNKQK